ncbi:MAG: hypothetical protein FWE36_01415 [Erysipelotrichales bacterium]|nr:hypothetical protein [Erysipelotrichales bacterium]
MSKVISYIFDYNKFKDDMYINSQIMPDKNFEIYERLNGMIAQPNKDGKYFIDGIEIKLDWCKTR